MVLAIKIRIHRLCTFTLTSLSSVCALAAYASAQALPTTTGIALTGVPSNVITLTATVTSGSTPVTVGQVLFCNASATYCTDINLLGTAQLTSAGTATLKLTPGFGDHSYNAVFTGTPNGATNYAGSTSVALNVLVAGTYPTTTAIAASGSVGEYTLTATVTGSPNTAVAPTGTVSFVDVTNNDSVLGMASLGVATAATNFLNSSSPATLPYPQFVAVADFNGDGNLDLAVPVYSIFTPLADMNIFLGKGNGTFTAGPAFPLTGQNVNNAAVGDFNGDGIADMAISLPDANEVQILLGNGDGSFTAMPAISNPYAARVVAAGDLNGDGNADLVVAGYEVTILLGKGDGTFTVGQTIPITGGGYSVAVGDYNGDGIPDLAIPNNSGSESSPSSVTILLGNGDGTFTQMSQSPPTGIEPLWIAAGDLRGNGILDLVVTNQNDGYPNLGSATVLLGNGDGTFTPTATSPVTGSNPESIAFADFNGDGKPDLAISNAGSNTVTVLLGNGDGTFATPLSFHAGINPIFAAVGDFNDDGLPDLAAANNYPNFTVTVLLDQFTETATATATGISPMGTGTHLVNATYPGNISFSASTSSTVGLTAVSPPSFAVTGTAVTVAPGATTRNTSTITVTPSGGFTGSVALTATITSDPVDSQNPPTLSFGSTSPVNITGVSPATATLTISTTAATSGALAYAMHPRLRWYSAVGTLALVLLFVPPFGIPVQGRKRTRLAQFVSVVVLAGGLAACSSSSGSGNPGTTPGTYTVSVTGTSGNIISTTSVTLTVQ